MSDQADDNDALFLKVLPIFQDLVSEEGLIDVYDSRDFGAFNAIIRSHTAPRELVDAVKAMILLVEDYEAKTCKVIRAAITIGKSDWQAEAKERELAMHRMFEFLDVLRSALSAQEPKVCEWGFRKFNSTLDPNIYINCKNEPIVAMYYDLSAKPYCPYCGGVIKVKESDK